MKEMFFVVIAVVLAAFAAIQFAGVLEVASASGDSKRTLELGKVGRVTFTAIFAVVMFMLAWMSHIPPLSTLVALAIAIGLVYASYYLRKNGIEATVAFLCVWMGNLLGSLKNTGYATANSSSRWGKAYIIFQVLCLLALLVGSVAGKLQAFFSSYFKENEEYYKEEETEDGASEEESEGDTPEEETEDGASEETVEEAADAEEDEEESLSSVLVKEDLQRTLMQILCIAIIVGILIIGYWLEVKFDFFPPYLD